LHVSGQKISHLEYQWYHYNHNAKRYENVIRGIINSVRADVVLFAMKSLGGSKLRLWGCSITWI
jgi:hypothetical protein